VRLLKARKEERRELFPDTIGEGDSMPVGKVALTLQLRGALLSRGGGEEGEFITSKN